MPKQEQYVDAAVEQAVEQAEKELAAMKRVLAILKKLPPDRRPRVLGAVAVLYGFAEARFPDDIKPLL